MLLNEISGIIVDSAIKIHTDLGPGLFESVYERVLAYELDKRGLRVECQKSIAIQYESLFIEEAFKADLIVENAVIVEIKSIETIARVHKKQLLTYLKLTGKHLGLLINFNVHLLKEGITRLAHNLEE